MFWINQKLQTILFFIFYFFCWRNDSAVLKRLNSLLAMLYGWHMLVFLICCFRRVSASSPGVWMHQSLAHPSFLLEFQSVFSSLENARCVSNKSITPLALRDLQCSDKTAASQEKCKLTLTLLLFNMYFDLRNILPLRKMQNLQHSSGESKKCGV